MWILEEQCSFCIIQMQRLTWFSVSRYYLVNVNEKKFAFKWTYLNVLISIHIVKFV